MAEAPGGVVAPAAREVRAALERGGQDLQDIVDVLRDQLGVAMAAVTVLDAGTFFFTTVAGGEPFENEHDEAVCRWSMPHDSVFSIEDLAADPRTASLPFVDGRLGDLRFYASAPLHSPAGTLVGRLCLFGTEPRVLAVVLQNLVANACTHSRAGVEPLVHVRAVDGPGVRRIEVLDNGPGVPPEHAQEVFQLFHRMSSEEGHGIGLSTVAVIVRAHGGTVGVDPNPYGPGSCFWFELPRGGDTA
jgi:signal transduction histidine kinase